jgi:hypothetical protein
LRQRGVLAGIPIEIDAGFHGFVRHMLGERAMDFPVAGDRDFSRNHFRAIRRIAA